MGKKSLLALCAAVVFGVGANAALAGEVTGKGDKTPIAEYRAASICSFSG